MKYKLVYASDLRRLQREVNEFLDFGFETVGGCSSNGRVFTQALLTKDEETDLGKLRAAQHEAEMAKLKKAQKSAKAEVPKEPTEEE